MPVVGGMGCWASGDVDHAFAVWVVLALEWIKYSTLARQCARDHSWNDAVFLQLVCLSISLSLYHDVQNPRQSLLQERRQ